MKIVFMAGPSSPLGNKYKRELVKLASSLDKQENDFFKNTTGLNIYENFRTTFEERIKGNYFLALDDDENLVGMVWVKVLKNEYREPTLALGDVMVIPRVRGQGVASALIEKTIEYAKNTACKSITLSVLSNNAAALRLYQKFGFITTSMHQVKVL